MSLAKELRNESTDGKIMVSLKNRALQPYFAAIVALASACSVDCQATPLDNKLHERPIKKHGLIEVAPRITIENGSVFVKLRFANVGDLPVLVMEGVNGFGIRGNNPHTADEATEDEYVIVSSGRKLRYLGDVYKREPYTIDYFKQMNPGEIIDVRFENLATAYEFFKGTHEYELTHYHLEFDQSSNSVRRIKSFPVKFVYAKK